MSTAILDVWVTNLGDPCSIANDPGLPNPWVIAVAHCNGNVLNWSEGRYRHHREDEWTPIREHGLGDRGSGWWYDSIPTRDGHVEIELPPGCYSIIGSMHTWFTNGVLYGNWHTDHAIVYARGGDEISTTLYAPSAMHCHWTLFEIVLPWLARQKVIDRAAADDAINALQRVTEQLPASEFERNQFDMLRLAFERMDTEPFAE